MQRSKIVYLSLFVLLLLIIVVSGCGDPTQQLQEASTTSTSEPAQVPTIVEPTQEATESESPQPQATDIPPSAPDTSVRLNSVWATTISTTSVTDSGTYIASSPEAFAVGNGGIILKYHDGILEQMVSPTTKNLLGVGGNDNQDVFAVGIEGTILHYDGSNWMEMSSGTSNDLTAVAGNGNSGAFAVGIGPTILRLNGDQWEKMSTENLRLGEQPFILSSIAVLDENNIFTGGTKGTLFYFNGTEWADIAREEVPETELSSSFMYPYDHVTGIWIGRSTGDIALVTLLSDFLFYSNGWRRFNSWEEDGIEVSQLQDIGGTGDGLYGPDIFIIGNDGLIIDITEDTLKKIDAGTTQNLYSISGSGISVFIVGENNMFLHYDGIQWNNLEIQQ